MQIKEQQAEASLETLAERLEELLPDPERLEAVHKTALMDSPAEEAFDRLTRLACHILDVPVALVSLIDDKRHYFKSHVGLPEPEASKRERPLAKSFCQYTMALGHPLVIEDASQHPLVSDNSATREFGIGGYMGMPLITSEKHAIGNFCVIDEKPRSWTREQLQALRDLSAAVMTEIEVRTLAREAETAREKAEQKAREAERAVRAREEILGVVTHDLRNPIQSIKLAAELLTRKELSKEKREACTERIQRMTEQMNRLVSDLLDITKMESGQISVDSDRVEAALLLNEVLDMYEPIAEEEGIELRGKIPSNLPAICADWNQVLRVFGNLIGNAIKFTPEGGRISIGAEPSKGEIQFMVEDTGVGIPEENLSQLFEPFWRERKMDCDGTGLGLPIAKGIVEAHGGRIWAESPGEEGSTFFFTIPTADSK